MIKNKKYSFVLFLLYSVFGYSQNTQNGVVFKVSDVQKATSLLTETSYKKALEIRINRAIEAYPIEKKDNKLVSGRCNAFLGAVHYSYAEHRPLIISPDMIWLLICQGFSTHVNENAEKLRKQLVNHDGIMTITVGTDTSFRKGLNNPWASVFDNITDSIKSYIKPNIYNLVVPSFSTTTSIERMVYQVVLMDLTKKYFQVVAESGCGIPEITLEGSTEDWQQIRENVLQFRGYEGLEVWVDNLIPVLDEFVMASKGQINKIFWQSIYKTTSFYNYSRMSGWVIKFFPYYQRWVHKKEYYYTENIVNPFINGEDYHLSNLVLDDFPSGISHCPFLWKIYSKQGIENHEMEICGGFMGINQNATTKSLKAEISWAVRDVKSSWLNKDDNENMTGGKAPKEYWMTEKIKKPDKLPIFCPDSAKTYTEGLMYLERYVKQKIDSLKKIEPLSGTVKVNFVVTWSGTIADVKVVEGLSEKENKLAEKIIASMPRWKPARIANKEAENVDGIKDNFKVNYPTSLVLDFGGG